MHLKFIAPVLTLECARVLECVGVIVLECVGVIVVAALLSDGHGHGAPIKCTDA